MIMSYIMNERRTVEACTLVCSCLRAVSLEYFFRTSMDVGNITSFDHLFSFLRANSRIGEKTLTLTMCGGVCRSVNRSFLPLTSIDDTVVARLMWLLPNLRSLKLVDFIYALPDDIDAQSTQGHQVSSPGPFSLQTLTFGSVAHHHKSSISGLFRILSLFSITRMSTGRSKGEFDTSEPLDLTVLHRPLRVEQLDLGGGMKPDQDCALMLTHALKETIEPGSLRALRAVFCSAAEVPAVGELLSRTGGGVSKLTLAGRAPLSYNDEQVWKDPLDSAFSLAPLIDCDA